MTFADPPCVTDTFAGLPVAPLAVTWIAPDRDDVPLFSVYVTVIVPAFVPEAGEIESQLAPDVTEANQLNVPPPVLATKTDVLPADFAAEIEVGETDKTGVAVAPACVTETLTGLPVAPAAVTWIAPVRDPVSLFAA